MKSKIEFNKMIRTMFNWQKLNIESGLFTYDQAIENTMSQYDDLYEWLVEEKMNKPKTRIDKQKAKKLIIVSLGIIVLGVVVIVIGKVI